MGFLKSMDSFSFHMDFIWILFHFMWILLDYIVWILWDSIRFSNREMKQSQANKAIKTKQTSQNMTRLLSTKYALTLTPDHAPKTPDPYFHSLMAATG